MLFTIGLAALLCILPTILFLGLTHTLKKAQQKTIVTKTTERLNEDTSVLTIQEVSKNAIRSQTVLPSNKQQKSSTTNNKCLNCNTDNQSYAVYCKNCSTPL